MKSILFRQLITLLHHLQNFETPILDEKQNSLTGPVITGSFEKRALGACLFHGVIEQQYVFHVRDHALCLHG